MGVIVIVVDAAEGCARATLRFVGRFRAIEMLDESGQIGESLLG